MADKKILVTGGAGYIGSHAVFALLEAGYVPIVVDNLVTGKRRLVPDNVQFVKGNAGDRELMSRIFEDYKIDAVMHFAGSIVVPESVQDPLKYYDNNTGITRNLIEAVVRANIGKFIFSSTAAVYGIPASLPVIEGAVLAPINPYGRSKLVVEWILRDVAEAHAFQFVALRYFNVAGADSLGRSGQASPEATHLIKIACEAAIGKRNQVEIFGTDFDTPDGTGLRDYIHVSDLAEAHVSALQYLDGGNDSVILNCGYGRGYSVREVLSEVEVAANKKLNIQESKRREGDPPALIADTSQIGKILRWTPKRDDLSLIVTSALEWEKELNKK